MSEREEFLARWSRRKRQVIESGTEKIGIDKVEDAPVAAAPGAPESPAGSGKEPPLPVSSEPLFDPATLPPIDSITAETDIRAFLAPGVPAELTRAALRRAWATDAKIRDFVGLAECAWDFNTPGAVPGFGPLIMTDEWRREIVAMLTRGQSRVFAEDPVAAAPEKVEHAPPRTVLDQAAAPAEPELRQQAAVHDQDETPAHNNSELRNKENVAVQNQPAQQQAAQFIVQRSHGRALPKL